MNEEEERVTLENFMDSSILERLLNETEEDKDIIHTINRESHTFLCKFEDNLLSEPPLHYYLHPLLVQLSPNCTKKYAISYTFQIKYWVKQTGSLVHCTLFLFTIFIYQIKANL